MKAEPSSPRVVNADDRRWLHNPRINVQRLYSPIIEAALATWDEPEITLLEDTTQLWNTYCLIRISVQYRGRAVPIAWRVLKHPSSMVDLETYQALLQRVNRLLPEGAAVRLLADRGFADTKLMSYLQQLGWHYRIRIKNSCWVYRPGRGWVQPFGSFGSGRSGFVARRQAD